MNARANIFILLKEMNEFIEKFCDTSESKAD
jgi:hypothetical protein